MDSQSLIGFLELLHRFQRIDRTVMRPGEDRFENDAEHSYQLAMTAWYLNDRDKLGMDTEKLLHYALAHDLVEIHAGDTFAFTRDIAERDSKQAREAAALRQLAEQLPDFLELIDTIHSYEKRDSREAKFVYALDKLLPMIGNYLDGGRAWLKGNVTLEMVTAYKADKVAESPEIEHYYKELVAILEKKPDFFPIISE